MVAARNALNEYAQRTVSRVKAKYKRNPRQLTTYKPKAVAFQRNTRRGVPFVMSPYPRRPYRALKTRRITWNVGTNSGGSTSTKLVFGKKRPPRRLADLYKDNQNYIFDEIYSNRYNAAFGKQSVNLAFHNTRPGIDAMFNTIPQLTSATLVATGKMFYEKMEIKTTFTNQDLATAYVTLYEITPRFHIPSGTYNPFELWDYGLELQSPTGASNDHYRDAYAKPFESEIFCLYYKVEKVVNFELQQGQSHCHEVTHYIHKAIHGGITLGFQGYRDITKYCLRVISGTPLNDLNNKALVSTSSIAVDIVEKVVKHYTYAASQRVLRTYSNTLGAITTAELVSIGAGTVQLEDEA